MWKRTVIEADGSEYLECKMTYEEMIDEVTSMCPMRTETIVGNDNIVVKHLDDQSKYVYSEIKNEARNRGIDVRDYLDMLKDNS